MKKLRFIGFLLVLSLMASIFSACSVTAKTEGDKYPMIKNEIIPADKTGARTDAFEQVSNPVLYGDFIQYWLYKDWTQEQWEKHFSELREAGMTSVILQFSFETADGKLDWITFENNFEAAEFLPDCTHCEACLGRALQAAKNLGCTLWIGLGSSSEWWDINSLSNPEWRSRQADFDKRAMKAIIDNYYSDFKDQIEGFYWSYEIYTTQEPRFKYWVPLLNEELDYLTSLDTGLPMMVAPFNSGYEIARQTSDKTAEDDYTISFPPHKAKQQWKSFFKGTHFRSGDVFCPQDSMYSQRLKEADALNYLIAMHDAMMEERPDMHFWADVESFTLDFEAADISRYIRQLNICCRLAEKCVGFSYSHYYSTAGAGGSWWKESNKTSYLAHAEKFLIKP